MELRDMSEWPEELQEAYRPGRAPLLDDLARQAGEQYLERLCGGATSPVDDLPIIIEQMVGGISRDPEQADLFQSLIAEALSFGDTEYLFYLDDYEIAGDETFRQLNVRLLAAMVRMRARLDLEVERADAERDLTIEAGDATFEHAPTFDEIVEGLRAAVVS